MCPPCSGEPICDAQRQLPGLPGQRPVWGLLCRHAEGARRQLKILLQDQAGGWRAVWSSRAQRLLDWHGWRAHQQGEYTPPLPPSLSLSHKHTRNMLKCSNQCLYKQKLMLNTHVCTHTLTHAVAPNHNSTITSHVSNCPQRGVRLLSRTKADLIIPQKRVVALPRIDCTIFPCSNSLLTQPFPLFLPLSRPSAPLIDTLVESG